MDVRHKVSLCISSLLKLYENLTRTIVIVSHHHDDASYVSLVFSVSWVCVSYGAPCDNRCHMNNNPSKDRANNL